MEHVMHANTIHGVLEDLSLVAQAIALVKVAKIVLLAIIMQMKYATHALKESIMHCNTYSSLWHYLDIYILASSNS